MESPFWVNEVYSIGHWLKKYAFYPTWLPLCNYINHGISLSNNIPKHELKNDAPVIFKFSPTDVNKYRKIANKSVHNLINPLIFYRNKKKITQNSNAEGTLYFPAHSTELLDNLTNWDKFIDNLNNIPQKFKPIDICLHPTDIKKGLDTVFISKGFKVFSAGSANSHKFAENFYEILKRYKYTASNIIGSYTFYSVEMGIPFSLYGEDPKLFNRGDKNIELGEYKSYKEHKRRQKARTLFKGFYSKATKEQKEFVEFESGKTHTISRIKASVVLYKALIAYIKEHPKFLMTIIMNLFGKIKNTLWHKPMKKIKKALFPILFFAKKFILKDGDYTLYKKKCASLIEIYRLKYAKEIKDTSILFGEKVYKTDSFWYLHSLKELFLDEVYKFPSDTNAPVILDCGSNIGLSVIFFKRLFPNAKITAFEADSNIYKLMVKNINAFKFDNIQTVNKAVWNEESVLNFSASGNLGGGLVDEESKDSRDIVQVPSVRLYDYLDKKIDFLKIDIEGAEIEVLKDCESRLSNVQNIFVEYHSDPNKPQELNTLLTILANAGFRYDIKEAWNNLPFPYFRENYKPCFDLQLNIFGYRIK